jgi:hypothetical protein
MTKALVLGTSNCMLRGGASAAIEEFFGRENVTNISLGATSGTFYGIFQFARGFDFADYDVIFLDCIVNEQSQVVDGRSVSHLQNAIRVLYECLPDRIPCVFLGFCLKDFVFCPDIVELLHRSQCINFGATYVSFREIILAFCYRINLDFGYNITPDDIYISNEGTHFKPELSRIIMDGVLTMIATLPERKMRQSVFLEDFFVIDSVQSAMETVVHSTSLRSARYGVFRKGSIIKLLKGYFLGFDYNEIGSKAYLNIYGDKKISKYLSFSADKPWMKTAGFYAELEMQDSSYMEVSDVPEKSVGKVEWTDSASITERATGCAELGNFYFAKSSLRNLAARTPSVSIQNGHPVMLESDLVGYLTRRRDEVVNILITR